MSSEPVVDVRHVTKEYALGLSGRTTSIAKLLRERVRHPLAPFARRERFRALDDVTFSVDEGEVVGVIGKNGAGKSTLLKILSRITYPTDGYVELAGRVGSLLEVGTGFHPELTGIENIYLNGTILGMTKGEIESRMEAIVDFAEIPKFLATPVKRYSSGMRVRLAFAVAAHLEPEILIIDEVLSVGDAGFQSKCLDKMKSLSSDDGRTVLYCSHNLVSVENLCERTLLLVDGRLDFDGPTEETVTRHLNTFPRAERGHIPGVFDLAAADRTGTAYDSVFKQLTLIPGSGLPGDMVRMGDPLQAEIEVEGLSETSDAQVTITVGSGTNQVLFRLSTRMQRLEAAHERCTRETIVLRIPAVPLTPGDYHMDVEVRAGDYRGTVDAVSRAATFSVVSADVLGTGHTFTVYDGLFVVPFDWELRPAQVTV